MRNEKGQFIKGFATRTGIKHSEEAKKKIREARARQGSNVWNKGKTGYRNQPMSEETKRKISEAQKGNKNHKWGGGKLKKICSCGKEYFVYPYQFLKVNHCSHSCAKSGSNHYNWKGGITPITHKIRGSLLYKKWQDGILNRDLIKCKKCGENRKSKLVAHHINNFSSNVELRFELDNGITFCRPCHKLFHHIYGRKNNNQKQVYEFIK